MYDPRTPYTHQNPSYTNRGTMNFVEKNGRTSQKLKFTHNNLYSEVQFRPDHHQGAMISDQDSGMASPPLWKSIPSPSRPLLGHRGTYQPFSPDSRAEAIARGRSELMEMVRHMPESSYELSLKDIVEHHHRAENQAPKTEDGSPQRTLVKVIKKEESKRFDRKQSFENKGLFLNMVSPFSFRSRKKKISVGNNSGRVSPKPEVLLKSGGEKDWWKKKFTGSSDSDSSKISTSTGSTGSSAAATGGDPHGRRKTSRLIIGCWHFFHTRRSKSAG